MSTKQNGNGVRGLSVGAQAVITPTNQVESLTNGRQKRAKAEKPVNHATVSATVGIDNSDSAAAVEDFFGLVVDELTALRTRAEINAIEAAAQLIVEGEAKGGRVHVTGIGKSEHVARYTASMLSSSGTPAYFLHATECVHGSVGQVRENDLIIAISNSGETPELLYAIDVVRDFDVKIICVSGRPSSMLAQTSDVFLYAGVDNEGGSLNLIPRASILAKIFVLCALSIALESRKGLTREQYARLHPSGTLGRLARGE